MSIFEVIVNHFNENIDVTSRHIEALTPYLAEAAHLLHQTIIDDGKVLCCTSGGAYTVGKQFCQQLAYSQQLERPSLPALFLSDNDAATLSLVDQQTQLEIYSRKIRALGQATDTLIIICHKGNETSLIHAIDTAREIQIPIIALTAGESSDISQRLNTDDVVISTPSLSPMQTTQLQFFVMQILADLLEQQLFGNLAS